jgi:hypothetical protein
LVLVDAKGFDVFTFVNLSLGLPYTGALGRGRLAVAGF